MKHIIILASLFVSCAFVSCKKQYTCSCKSATSVEVKKETIKVKEYEEAQKECTSIETGMREQIPSAGVKCLLID